MFSNFASEMNNLTGTAKLYIYPWIIGFAILLGVNIINWILGSPLKSLGLYPRRFSGLIGILFSPILHQNFSHLFFNTIPLFALGLAILAKGLTTFIYITSIVVLLGGSLVWLFGRRAIHIGASGLVSGYFGYILVTAYLNPSFTALLLAIFVAYYFGSIFLGIFPQEEKISWESHLFGFISGITAAFFMTGQITFKALLSSIMLQVSDRHTIFSY